MNIKLTPALEKLIRDRVEFGLYVDESDVVRDALRRLDAEDTMDRDDLESLRDAIDEGLAELDAGRGLEVDQHLRKFFPKPR